MRYIAVYGRTWITVRCTPSSVPGNQVIIAVFGAKHLPTLWNSRCECTRWKCITLGACYHSSKKFKTKLCPTCLFYKICWVKFSIFFSTPHLIVLAREHCSEHDPIIHTHTLSISLSLFLSLERSGSGLEIEGLQLRASPGLLCCVLKQDTFYLSSGSTKRDFRGILDFENHLFPGKIFYLSYRRLFL